MELSRLGMDLLCHHIPVYVIPSLTLSPFSGTHFLLGVSFFAPTHGDRVSDRELASFSKDIFKMHFMMLTRMKKISSGYRDIISNTFLEEVSYSEQSSKV